MDGLARRREGRGWLGRAGHSLKRAVRRLCFVAVCMCVSTYTRCLPPDLSACVSGCVCVQVASRLWQLVVIDSRLVDHLAALKDYLLLAKGDFWTSFLVNAARQLSLPAGTKVDLGERGRVEGWFFGAQGLLPAGAASR